jgi:hypothetical protein
MTDKTSSLANTASELLADAQLLLDLLRDGKVEETSGRLEGYLERFSALIDQADKQKTESGLSESESGLLMRLVERQNQLSDILEAKKQLLGEHLISLHKKKHAVNTYKTPDTSRVSITGKRKG